MAKHKKTRKDLSGPQGSLSYNPFAALADMRAQPSAVLPVDDDVSAIRAPAQDAKTQPDKKRSQPPWSVQRSRKGHWDVHIEKRGGGKIVTRLQGVSGDVELLLKRCKKHCGCGGALRAGGLELQGDQVEALKVFLQNN